MEARERARFRILAHACALSGGNASTAVLCCRLADDLGFFRSEAADLIAELVRAGLLADGGAGPSVTVTPEGAAFARRDAGRRRSVRGALRPPPRALASPPLWRRLLAR